LSSDHVIPPEIRPSFDGVDNEPVIVDKAAHALNVTAPTIIKNTMRFIFPTPQKSFTSYSFLLSQKFLGASQNPQTFITLERWGKF
jgi:hypothetical protein